MKYSFMSFSCPEATLPELLAIAERFGYDGVEPRAAVKNAHGIELTADAGQRRAARRHAEKSPVRLCCLATSLKYADPASVTAMVAETGRYLELAADVGIPALRVFGGLLPEGMGRDRAVEQVAAALGSLAARASSLGVALCLETHDDWCDPADVVRVMDIVNSPAVMVNWDIMHPVRRAQKTIDEAWEQLGDRVGHVHFHDGVTRDGRVELCPVGRGEVDHRRAVELLQQAGYQGYLSGEWIAWSEPWETYLPRELGTMRSYER